MLQRTIILFLLSLSLLLVTSCAPKIYGTVQLVDPDMKPIENESPAGTVVNMINTTAKVENASTSVTVDEKGEFESEEESIVEGTYKVEASRIGYETQTETAEIGGSTQKEIEFILKKIPEGKRTSIQGAKSDEDKIINPGEVNIQPPGF